MSGIKEQKNGKNFKEMKNKKMVTSIRIDRELWQAFIADCQHKNLKAGPEMERMIKRKLTPVLVKKHITLWICECGWQGIESDLLESFSEKMQVCPQCHRWDGLREVK